MTDTDISTPGTADGEASRHPATAGHLGLHRRWSTAFLIAGSALFGATAIALWNWRTITNMRAQLESQSPEPAVSAEEII